MGAGARIEKAILDIQGSKMSAVIKDKIGIKIRRGGVDIATPKKKNISNRVKPKT